MDDPTSLQTNGAPDKEAGVQHDDKLELRVWLRLLTCATMIEREVRGRLRRDFEITLPRFDVLAQLDRAADGLTMGELSGRLMVSNGNITGLIDRLVAEGLVTRAAKPGDRRSVHVRLTDKGKQAFDAMTPAHEAWIDEMLAGLSRREMADLYELLARLKSSAAPAEMETGD